MSEYGKEYDESLKRSRVYQVAILAISYRAAEQARQDDALNHYDPDRRISGSDVANARNLLDKAIQELMENNYVQVGQPSDKHDQSPTDAPIQ